MTLSFSWVYLLERERLAMRSKKKLASWRERRERQRGEGDVSLEFSGRMEENRGGSKQRLCPAGPAKHLGIIPRGFYRFLLSRVFQRNACSRSKGNVVLSKPGVLSRFLPPFPPSLPSPGNGRCQKLCFSTVSCTAFTFFERSSSSPQPRCTLFKSCKGQRRRCSNCIRWR